MEIKMSIGALHEIESEKHLENHLNYLFRTDGDQKFTKEERTNFNLVFTWDGFQVHYLDYGNSFQLRKFSKSQIRSQLYREYPIVNDLGTGAVFLDFSDTVVIDEYLLTDIMRKFDSLKLIRQPLFFVLLMDMDVIRLQFVYPLPIEGSYDC